MDKAAGVNEASVAMAEPAAEPGRYVVPFAALRRAVPLVSVQGQLKVDLRYEDFLDVVRRLLQGVAVDEAFYRATYPDVAEAIAAGLYRNARAHFVANGYLEGRQPFAMAVDEAWYLATYPDVVEGIEDGAFKSAQDHFTRHGYEEGRRPAR